MGTLTTHLMLLCLLTRITNPTLSYRATKFTIRRLKS